MSIQINQTDLSPCLLMQTQANKYFGKLQADSNKPFTGMLDSLKSSVNNVAMQITDDINDGHTEPTLTSKRKVHIRYIKPTCADEVDVLVDECNIPSQLQNAWGTASLTVGEYVQFGFELNEEQFTEMCEDRTTIYMENFKQKYYNALKRMDKRLLEIALGFMGNYPNGVNSGTNPEPMNFISPDKTPNIGALAEMKKLYRIMGYNAEPIMVGDNDLEILNMMKGYLTVSQNGIDMGKLNLDRFFYDGQANATLIGGEPALLTYMPGTFQLVEYIESDRKNLSMPMTMNVNNQQVSRFQKQIATQVLEDGKWTFHYIYDCGLHKFSWSKKYDLFALPQDAVCENKYPALLFKVGCGGLDCTNNFF